MSKFQLLTWFCALNFPPAFNTKFNIIQLMERETDLKIVIILVKNEVFFLF